MQTTATLSPCRLYRYRLDRWWSDRPRVAFVMLNPSTADETKNDKTITRLIGYARDWNLGGFAVANLFAWRATDPDDMRRAVDPIGPDNDAYILEVARSCCAVIVGWGTDGAYRNRGQQVAAMLRQNGIQPLAFDVTKDGHPKHPLYLKRSAIPSPYLR